MILASIWTFVLYSESLGGPFIFDDKPNITQNTAIRLGELSTERIKEAAFGSPMSMRPVAYASFALNYYFHGYEVWGYRVVNVLIHILTSFLLYLLVKTTLQTPVLLGRYNSPREISMTAALLFLVHPVAVQSVAYVVQRMTSLAALFFILSLLCYAKARLTQKHRTLFFMGSLAAALLALGSKEIAATLPVIILLYEWYFFQDLSWDWAKRRIGWLIIGLIAIGVIALVFLGGDPINGLFARYDVRDFSLAERLLTELRVVVYYLSLLVFPHPSRLNLDYDFGLSTSLVDPVSTLAALIALVGLAGLAVYTARRYRLLSFAIWWYLINLVIESSVIPLEIIFEHRTYLPFMMMFVVFAAFFGQLVRESQWRLIIIGLLVLVMSFWTYQRAAVWGDDIALWHDVVSKSPGKARSHHNLGVMLRNKNQYKEAIPHFKEAVRLDPKYVEALQNLGAALLKTGSPETALTYFTKAIELEPSFAKAHLGRGTSLSELGRTREAIEAFDEVIRLEPNHTDAHLKVGRALLKTGQAETALAHFTKAAELMPSHVNAHLGRGESLSELDRTGEAIGAFEEVIRLLPNYPLGHIKLGVALSEVGRVDEAITHFQRAADLDRNSMLARKNLAVLLFNKGEVEKAVKLLKEAARLAPNNAAIRTDLGFVLLKAGRRDEAIEALRNAINLDPELTSAKQLLRQITGEP